MSKSKEDQISRVSDFYEGKSLFISGAAGYLGAVLLEILLRCLPGISNIYILLRSKKGVDPQSRKSLLFQKSIFNELLEKNPSVVDKVHVIPGDVTQPKLGMSDDDIAAVVKNVSIVFHVAATISFFKPMRYVATQNCLGTKHIIELCRKIRNLEVLVYTSTAFSNSNRFPDIEEKIYRLPFRAERYLDSLENGKEGEFEKLVAMCQPEWPNAYTFSKCLAENIINDMATDLPVALLRPSIIGCTWKGTNPGYIEEGNGLVDFSIAVGKGFARVIQGDLDSRLDLIPADIVANAHVAAAWCVATNRLPSPLIVNCTGGHTWNVTFRHYTEVLLKSAQKHMLPKTFQEPSFKLVKNKYWYSIYVIYEHYIPAYILDIILSIQGSKLRLVKLYTFFERVMLSLSYFISHTFDFAVDNFNALSENLDPRDKEIFYMDLSEVDLTTMVENLRHATDIYNWKVDKKSPEKRKQTVLVRTMMINFVRRFSVVLMCFAVFIIFKLL